MSDSELKKLGANIKAVRLQRKLTQVEVAERADTGVNYYAQIERGEVNPSYALLRSIAKAFGVKLSDIIPS